MSALLVWLLDEAAKSGVALDPPLVWSQLEEVAPREQVTAAMAMVDKLGVPTDDGSAEIALRITYRTKSMAPPPSRKRRVMSYPTPPVTS